MERKSSTEYSVVFLGKQKVQVTFKVHLTPKFFSLSNEFCYHFEHSVTKSFWFGLIPDFLCAVEVRKIGRK